MVNIELYGGNIDIPLTIRTTIGGYWFTNGLDSKLRTGPKDRARSALIMKLIP